MSQELDDLLFHHPKPKMEQSRQGEDLKQLIDNIPYPHVDITITSYSEFSDNTPQKFNYLANKPVRTENIEPHSYKLKRIPTQADQYATDGSDKSIRQIPFRPDIKSNLSGKFAQNDQKQYYIEKSYEKKDFGASGSGGSYLESMTPQRMNRIVDWSKNHVTPGDGKNIFPQVIAPSIEFTNDNSVSLNINSKQQSSHQQQQQYQQPPPQYQQQQQPYLEYQKTSRTAASNDRIDNKVWEKQKKHMELEIQQIRMQMRKLDQENHQLQNKLSEADERSKLLSEKYKDFTCLENLRGRYLEQAKQQLKNQQGQLTQKELKIQQLQENLKYCQENEKLVQEAIEVELKDLHNQMDVKEQMIKALKHNQQQEQGQKQGAIQEYEKTMAETNKYISKLKQQMENQMRVIREKESLAEDQEKQISTIQTRLHKEQEYRKQDERIINELRQKETLLYQQLNPTMDQQHSNRVNEDLQREYLNQKKIISNLTEQLQNAQFCIPAQSRIAESCQNCHQSRQELQAILMECSLEFEEEQVNLDQPMPTVIREVVTLLLTKQREQIDSALQLYEDQQKELTQQIEYFKDQNEEVLSENNRISEQIQVIIQQKEVQEQQIFDEYEKLRVQNIQLQKDIKEQKSVRKEDGEVEQLKQQLQQLSQVQQEYSQCKSELQLYKQQLLNSKNTENKLIAQSNQYKSVQDEKSQISKEMNNLKTQFQLQINELQTQLLQANEQNTSLKKELNVAQQNIIDKNTQLESLLQQQTQQQQQIERIQNQHQQPQIQTQPQQQYQTISPQVQDDSVMKKQSKLKDKALHDLNDEKNKLLQKIQQLEQQLAKEANNKQLEERIEKIQQLQKEKDKKNIELYNQNRSLMQSLKEHEESAQQHKDDVERSKKQLSYKNQEIKALLEQVKQLQEKNNEVNTRVTSLQQQIQQFEQEIKGSYIEQSSQIPERLKSQSSLKQLETMPGKVNELVEGFTQYQQEFYQMKKVFTDRLKRQEQLQENIQQLQHSNYTLSLDNQKLLHENTQIKDKLDELQHKRQFDETAVRGSAATGDSLNIRSFLNNQDQDDNHKRTTNIFQQNQLSKGTTSDQFFSIVDLVQPEVMSMEDTIQIFREILCRSIRSVEMIKQICSIPEIKELLIIVLQVEEKFQNQSNLSQQRKAKIISSILMGSNVKQLGSDLSRKKSGQRQKQSTRSETGVMDFLDS